MGHQGSVVDAVRTGRSKESLDWRFCPCEISRAKSRETPLAPPRCAPVLVGSGVQRREQNNTIVHDDDNISHFAFRISHFAFRISHFAFRTRERLRKPDTLFDFAQIGHFIGFRVDTLAPTLRTLRHETLSESVSCRC